MLIAVNASTDPEPEMDRTRKQPSLKDTIGAMSDVQLHRYNIATIKLMQYSVNRWAQALPTPGRPVTPYLIGFNFADIQDPELRRFLNRTPTSFDIENDCDRSNQLSFAPGRLAIHRVDSSRCGPK